MAYSQSFVCSNAADVTATAKVVPPVTFLIDAQAMALYVTDSAGVAHATAGGTYTLPPATPGALGGVKQAADVPALTDGTGGVVSATLAAIAAGAAYSQPDQVAIKNALASLAANQTALLSAIKAAGTMA